MFLLLIWVLFYTNANNNILSEKHCVNCRHFVKNPFCHDTLANVLLFVKKTKIIILII